MSLIPEVQILEREQYFTQHLIPILDEDPNSQLGLSSVRIRTKVIGLTASNITVAKVEFLFGWWDVHPLPKSTPAPFNDSSRYGRTSAWGYAEVLESTAPFVEKGDYLWGYQPIGTLAQDLEVRDAGIPDHVIVTSAHRQHIAPFYNRYIKFSSGIKSAVISKSSSIGYDACIRVMYETSYLLAHFVFAAVPGHQVHPGPDMTTPWTADMADLTAATVVNFAPGSKAGLSLAHILKYSRTAARPRRLVAAPTSSSYSFVEATGIYDYTKSTDESALEALTAIGAASREKIVLVDFGGRGGVAQSWATKLRAGGKDVLLLSLGNEIAEMTPQEFSKSLTSSSAVQAVRVSVSSIRDRAIALQGEERYFGELNTSWRSFRAHGVRGLDVTWGSGMEAVRQGWEQLTKGELKAGECLAYLI